MDLIKKRYKLANMNRPRGSVFKHAEIEFEQDAHGYRETLLDHGIPIVTIRDNIVTKESNQMLMMTKRYLDEFLRQHNTSVRIQDWKAMTAGNSYDLYGLLFQTKRKKPTNEH